MPTLIRWKAGAAIAGEDPFTAVDDDQPVPKGDVIVSLTRFQSEGERLLSEGRSVGVRVNSDEAVEALAYDLPRIALVALAFRNSATGAPTAPRASCVSAWPSPARCAPWAMFCSSRRPS